MKAEELYESVTAQLIAEIESGAGNWEMPWHTLGAAGLATSIDDRRYRGLNCLILSLASAATGWHSNTWGTYKAWQRHGHQVSRGERGTKVLLWKKTENDPTDEAQAGVRMFARTFTVFSQEQTNAPLHETSDAELEAAPVGYPEAAEALATSGARVTTSAQPHYNKATDTVGMPDRASFKSEAFYLSTLAHECVHWTGHPSRLDRDMSGRFGDQAYGFEELVAEIGAAFWCAHHKITDPARRLDHADYLSDWLQILRTNSRAILTAASRAQAAVDHLHQLAGDNHAEVTA